MNSIKKTSSSRRMRAGLLAGCVLAGALAGVAQAQPFASPVGDWDTVVSGSQQGVAFLHFDSDFTLHGWEVVTHRLAPGSSSSDGRGDTSGRGGSTQNTNTILFFIGYSPIAGVWNFTTDGKLVGNITAELSTNLTGGYSFTGVAHTGRNLMLNAVESPNPGSLDHRVRHLTLRGSPLASVPLGVTPPVQPDLSGTWLAQGNLTVFSTNGLSSSPQYFTESFTLKSLTGGDPTGFFTDLASSPFASQSYVIMGVGPGYTNFGLALQSSRKRLAFRVTEFELNGTNSILRAAEGPLNTNKFTASPMGGVDENLSSLKYRLQRTVLD